MKAEAKARSSSVGGSRMARPNTITPKLSSTGEITSGRFH